MDINKLLGFYKLKVLGLSGLPYAEWNEYHENLHIDDNNLWTLRTATISDDTELPYAIALTSKELHEKAKEFKKYFDKKGLDCLIIYYPYFIAKKSGTLTISNKNTIIKATEDDLWNLLKYGNINVTVIKNHKQIIIEGENQFLSKEEIEELLRYGNIIARGLKDELGSDKNILLEWSYVYRSDSYKKPLEFDGLKFYMLKTFYENDKCG